MQPLRHAAAAARGFLVSVAVKEYPCVKNNLFAPGEQMHATASCADAFDRGKDSSRAETSRCCNAPDFAQGDYHLPKKRHLNLDVMLVSNEHKLLLTS
jgi:hypothetical protein